MTTARTPSAHSSSTYACSLAGSRSLLHSRICWSNASACHSTALAKLPQNGLATDGTTRPIVLTWPVRSWRAAEFGR